MKILGLGTVPLGGEIRQLEREVVEAFQNLCTVRYLANARERRRGDGLGDAIFAEGSSVEPDLGHTSKNGLYIGRQPASPENALKVVRYGRCEVPEVP
jgi:hypothetical protein